MVVINMTKTCKANGIDSFSRTRGGWMKQVEGLDKTQSNGYSFIGSNFIKVGNFKSNIMNGLYLDQSTSVEDNRKILTMNLFKIIDGDVELLKTVPKTNGWAIELWDEVEEYFKTQNITAQEIVNQINELTNNKTILEEVVDILTFDAEDIMEQLYRFRNWFEVRSYLAEMECHPTPVKLVEKYSPEVDYVLKTDGALSHADKKLITKTLNFAHDITIDENTFIDCKSIDPQTIKRDVFQRFFKMHEDTFYIAHTTGNNTGYHNANLVIMYFYIEQENTVVIRHFRYHFNTCKAYQKPQENSNL